MTSSASVLPPALLSSKLSVLVLRYDKVGDLLVSTPFLNALREHLPQARIDVLSGKHNRHVAAKLDAWNIGSLIYEKSLSSIFSLVARNRRRYDVIVDMMDNPSRTSALLLRLLAPAYSVGFDHAHHAHAYRQVTHAVALPDRRSVHIIDCMKVLLTPFGIDAGECSSRPSIPGYVSRETARGIDVLVHISAGKEQLWWGEERYRALCEHILALNPGVVLRMGSSASDAERARRIVHGLKAEVLPPVPSFAEYCSYINEASLLVTPDTSVVHAASALGTPTVVMYAKPHDDRMPWYPYDVPFRAVISRLDHGVEDVSVNEVGDAVQDLRNEIRNGDHD